MLDSKHGSGQSTDVIVIGSGFGGSVTAARLVEAGLSVILLERGPWRDTLPVQEAGIESRKPLPRTGGMLSVLRSLNLPFGPKRGVTLSKSGYLEIWAGEGIKAVCTSNVGGGSHIWAAVLEQPAEGFWNNRAQGISDAILTPHYEQVFAELMGVQPPIPAEVPNHTDHAWSDASYFSRLGPGEQPPMGVLYPKAGAAPIKVQNRQGVVRRQMDFQTDHGMFGCPEGSKSTVDALYLLPSLQKGLVVKDMHEVSGIVRSGEQGYNITARDHRLKQNRQFSAHRIVLAAGTMNTNKLLLNAGTGLEGMPALGKGFGANGDLLGTWPMAATLGRDATLGTPVQGRVKISGHENTGYILLAAGETPPVPGFLRKGARKKASTSYQLVAMSQDAADGEISLEKGRVKLSFQMKNSPSYDSMMTAFEALSKQSGTEVSFDRKAVFTAHPMGGCRVADTADEGVVNGVGEVHGNPDLFICDASIFPQPVGVPPSATIAAWASHVAQQIIQSQG